MESLIPFIAATIRLASPLTLASLGGIFAERAGIVIISLEGMMLAGAFAGFAVSVGTGSLLLGAAAAMAAGMLVGWVHAVLCIAMRADQIVVGIAVNLAVLGATAFLNDAIFDIQVSAPHGKELSTLAIPWLSEIPFLGPVLFRQNALVYAAILLVPLAWFALFKTHWGVAVRAVGEHPAAAETAGLNVRRVRYQSVLLCGTLAGLAGAMLTLGSLNIFVMGMTAGRGFIAYAALIMGRWNPWMVAVATLLFGVADALQLRVQAIAGLELPYQVALMLPYVVTLLFVALFGRRARYPAAAGVPYP